MIYSGDNDAICATLGTQQFMWDLGHSAPISSLFLVFLVPGYDAQKNKMWNSWKVETAWLFKFSTARWMGKWQVMLQSSMYPKAPSPS